MPFTTRELIECFSKVLDGTLVACGSRIGRGPDVVFKVSFDTAIMSLVFNFKCWKLNNSVFISFCATSRIWNWHSISWLVKYSYPIMVFDFQKKCGCSSGLGLGFWLNEISLLLWCLEIWCIYIFSWYIVLWVDP
jgi:hypothetical protein